MDLTTFIIEVFCWIDDALQHRQLRQHGPAPLLRDSEVLTMEVVGEFLGMDTDRELYDYFRQSWADWFPALCRVDRTTFARQAANLWRVKESLWQRLLDEVAYDPAIVLVDSFPVPLARFARAQRCRRLREWADWGYDDMDQRPFFGLRAHVRVCWPGVIVGLALYPASVHDRWAADDLLAAPQPGWVLGDRNYTSPLLQHDLSQAEVTLLSPTRSPWTHGHPWPRWLIQVRRRVETVISQLTERFHAKKVWAHDPWHCCSRWLRKILSHTFAVFFAQRLGLDSPLRFAEILTV